MLGLGFGELLLFRLRLREGGGGDGGGGDEGSVGRGGGDGVRDGGRGEGGGLGGCWCGGYGETLGGEGLEDGVPAALEGLDALLEFFVLAFTFASLLAVLFLLGLQGRRGGDGEEGDPPGGAEGAVLLFEFRDPALEIGELGFPAIARVLGGDAVAVCTGLLAVLGALLGAGALAGRGC